MFSRETIIFCISDATILDPNLVEGVKKYILPVHPPIHLEHLYISLKILKIGKYFRTMNEKSDLVRCLIKSLMPLRGNEPQIALKQYFCINILSIYKETTLFINRNLVFYKLLGLLACPFA